MAINIKSFSKANKLQDAAFVQLKDAETGELAFTENDKPIGFELYSMQSKEFKRAQRNTADLGLTKAEQKRYKEINENINDGVKPSEEMLDFLDECDDKVTKRMQRIFALVTKKLHYIELEKEDADALSVKVGKNGAVTETVENIHQLYMALPDMSRQIGDGITKDQNFINA